VNFVGYLDRGTVIHRLDPRIKIIALIVVSGSLFVFNHPAYVAIAFCFTLILGAIARVMDRIWQLRIPLLISALVSALTWPFYLKSGTILFTFAGFEITDQSALYGLAMGLRWAGAIICGVIFLSTTRPDDLYAALVLMRLPYVIAFVISLTFRLVPTFIGVGVGIREAQVSRGLDTKAGNIFNRARKLMSLAVPLFMHAVRQTNMTTVALESRAFGSRTTRTFYRQYNLRATDYVALALTVTVLLFFIWLRWAGFGVVLHDRL
jgi:energy-coupling factor transport system permease protein